MTHRQFALFLCGLVAPSLYQRIKFALHRRSFYTTRLRDKSGLNLHHGHWGLLFVFVSTWMLAFGLHSIVSIGLAGFGWGLMLDEIVPLLKMPSPSRDIELDVYARSRNATFVFISIVIILSIVIFANFCR